MKHLVRDRGGVWSEPILLLLLGMYNYGYTTRREQKTAIFLPTAESVAKIPLCLRPSSVYGFAATVSPRYLEDILSGANRGHCIHRR